MNDLRIWYYVMDYLPIADVVRFLRTSHENKKLIETYLSQILPVESLSSRLKSIYSCKYCHKGNVLDNIWKQTEGSSCTYCHKCCRCGR